MRSEIITCKFAVVSGVFGGHDWGYGHDDGKWRE
jgi:hypothetical protein